MLLAISEMLVLTRLQKPCIAKLAQVPNLLWASRSETVQNNTDTTRLVLTVKETSSRSLPTLLAISIVEVTISEVEKNPSFELLTRWANKAHVR